MRKKILLFYGLFSKDQDYDWIPSGPLFVAGYLKAAGYDPILIHEYKDRDYEHIIRKHSDEIMLLGISAMTGYQIKSGINAVKCLRKYTKNIPVVWGGAQATEKPFDTLKSEYVDYVYVGPIKQNFIQFLNSLEKKAPIDAIPDILSKNYFNDKPDKSYEIIDYKVSFSDFPSLNYEDYDFSYLLTANKVLNYTTSMGCPGNCTFCSWGGKHPWTSFRLERILDDITYLVKRYKLKSLWIADSELSIKKDHLLGLAQGIIDRKLDISWRGNARAVELNKYDKSDFSLLERSGCDRFFIGLENINLEIQRIYKKVIPREVIFNILENIRDFDIKVMFSFIFGNPGGPLTDLEENRQFLNECLKITPKVKFQVCFYTPYPGSKLCQMAIEKGYKAPKSFEEYAEDPFFIDTNRSPKRVPWFSQAESDDYLRRFNQLFPVIDSEPEWNWRKSKSAGINQ